jgi:N12 class adenine-specific DNA methylase
MSFNKKNAYQQNLLAIKEIFAANQEKRKNNPEILKKYIGYGGLKEILLNPEGSDNWNKSNQRYASDVKELYQVIQKAYNAKPELAKKMINSLKSSVLTSFYTEKDLINSIVAPLSEVLSEKPLVLEPSCGTGNYLESVYKYNPDAIIDAYEIEKLSGFIADKVYQAANVVKQGFETLENYEQKYDLVISNIPFGDISVYDKSFNKFPKSNINYKSQAKIHNFFFTKSMMATKKNGYVAFITSTGVMDTKNNKELREELMLQSELVSAFRLPNNTFKDGAGTEVNSDIIILKKRNERIKGVSLLNEKEAHFIEVNNYKETEINQYYIDNPARILGEFEKVFLHNRESYAVAPNEKYQDLNNVYKFVESKIIKDLKSDQKIVQKIEVEELEITPTQLENTENLSGQMDMFSSIATNPIVVQKQKSKAIIPEQSIEQSTEESVEQDVEELDYSFTEQEKDNLVLGTFVVKHDKFGIYTVDEQGNEVIEPVINRNLKIDKVQAFINVKNAYQTLIDSELKGEVEQLDQKRENLNKQYDHFTENFGVFHARSNSVLYKNDIESYKVFSIENATKDLKWVKGDIFGKATVIPTLETKVSTLEEAFIKSINEHGALNFDYISAITGETIQEIQSAGVAKGILFPNPIFSKEFNHYDINSQPLEELEFDYVTKDEFQSGPIASKIHVLYTVKDKLYLDSEKLYSNHIGLLDDVKPTLLKIDEIQPKLGEYWMDDLIYTKFATEHLQTSCSIQRNMDNWLIKSGNSSIINDYYYYKQINNRKIDGITIITHALKGTTHTSTYSVGTKENKVTRIDTKAITFANMKTKEMNDKFKEFVYNDKALSERIERKYNSLFNLEVKREISANILEFKEMKHFKPRPHQAKAIYQNIVNNGGINDHMVGAGKTLVIIGTAKKLKELNIAKKPVILGLKANTQEIYLDYMKAYPNAKVLFPGKADFTPAKRKEFLHRVINNDWDAVIMTHDQFKAVPQDPELTQNIINKEIDDCRDNLESLVGEDEPTKAQRKGLEKRINNLNTNLQRSYDQQKKDQIGINFKDLGIDHILIDESHVYKNLQYNSRHTRVSGLSPQKGSDIANDMLVAIRTVQNKYGTDKGATFLSGTTLSNSVVEMYALMKYLRPSELEKRGIANFDSWARTFAEISVDFEISITNEVKPKARFRAFTKAPEIAAMYSDIADVINDDNLTLDKPTKVAQLIQIEPTDFQKDFNKKLIDCIKTDDFSSIGFQFTDKQLKAKMLLATGLSSKMSLDTRLVYPGNHISEGSKIHRLCEIVNKEHTQSKDYKGTQFVFCDLGVPGTDNAKEFLDVYQSIKDNLVIGYGFEESEIQFIHDFEKDKERSELFNHVNDGKVRIVIGSTKKMGTGVNMQRRCVAIHHLDIPWTPKDVEQRDGRGVRQGNEFAKKFNDNNVNVYSYATKMSLDAYKYFLVETKKKFIDQIKNNTVSVRTINEDDADGATMSKADFIAELSGQKELIAKMKVDKKIEFLVDKKAMLDRNKSNAIGEKVNATESIPKLQKHLVALNKDKEIRDNLFPMSIKEQKKVPTLTINGVNYDDGKIIGEKIIEMQQKFLKVTSENVGEFEFGNIGDFKLIMEFSKVAAGTDMFTTSHELKVISDNSPIRYSHGSKIISDQPGTVGRYPLDCLNKIDHLIASQTEQIARMEQKIKSCDLILFDKALDTSAMDNEILELRAESLALQEALENGDQKEVEEEVEKSIGM